MKKKQMLSCIDALLGATKACRGLAKNPLPEEETDSFLESLSSCQEAAISLGNALEERTEDTKALVALLEEYCEQLYELTLHLQ